MPAPCRVVSFRYFIVAIRTKQHHINWRDIINFVHFSSNFSLTQTPHSELRSNGQGRRSPAPIEQFKRFKKRYEIRRRYGKYSEQELIKTPDVKSEKETIQICHF